MQIQKPLSLSLPLFRSRSLSPSLSFSLALFRSLSLSLYHSFSLSLSFIISQASVIDLPRGIK